MTYDYVLDVPKYVVLEDADVNYLYSSPIIMGSMNNDQYVNLAYRTGTSDTVYNWFHFDVGGSNSRLTEIDVS